MRMIRRASGLFFGAEARALLPKVMGFLEGDCGCHKGALDDLGEGKGKKK